MSDQLTIDTPPSASSWYVVAAHTRLLGDPEHFIGALLDDPQIDPASLAGRAHQLIGTPELRIRAYPARRSPHRAELPNVAAPRAERARMLAAPHHLVIESDTSPHHQPHTAQVVRTIARALTAATNGHLIDLATATLEPPHNPARGERPWFRLADHWTGIDCLITPDDTTPADRCACLCLFTRGLTRFALPELVIDHMPCDYNLAATNLLRGLAVKLLTHLWHHSRTRRLRIDNPTTLTPEHFSGYWGAHPRDAQPVTIHLAPPHRPDLPPGRYLTVLPHPGFTGTPADWATKTLNQYILAHIAEQPPDDPPYRIDQQ